MFRNKVRQFRELHQLSQEELAIRSGITSRTIARIEGEPEYVPSGDTMVKLANYFNCELGVLFWIDRTVETDKIAV